MNIPKTKIEIPDGFRALREDETITSSDLYSVNWIPVVNSVGKTPKRMNDSRRLRGKPEAVYIRAVEPAAAPKVPEGYRMLVIGETVASGDLVLSSSKEWIPADIAIGCKSESWDATAGIFFARPVETLRIVQRRRGQIEIPTGWRQLDRNEFRQEGDLFEACGEWIATKVPGGLVSKGASGPYIRRIGLKAEKELAAENLREGQPTKFFRGEVVTPRGWRRVYKHEKIQVGDFFTGSAKKWMETGCAGSIGNSDLAYFRRIS